MTPRSIQPPRRHAATTPSGTAIETARISVQIASETVGCSRPTISSATGFLKKNDSPKSPRTTLPIQMTNCWAMGRSSPSLVRMAATSCDVALSPAMMAAGSPVVSRRSMKTVIATTAMTGMVATSRRAMYPSMVRGQITAGRRGIRSSSSASERRLRSGTPPRLTLLLLDVPEDGDRRLHHAAHVLAHRDRAEPVAERDVRRVLRGTDLDRLGDLLLLRGIRLSRELVAQALDLLVAGPAEHGLLARGVQEPHHHGVQDVGRDPRGEEGVPAARRRRILLRAPGHERLPVHRLHVDLEAALLEERLGDGRQVVQHREIRRVH